MLDRDAYLLAENRVYRELFARAPRRLNDLQRIVLARAAKPLGRTLLAELATLVSPDTLLRWHRRLVEKAATETTEKPAAPGRPLTEAAVVQLVLRFARENPSWGYDRIAGALTELGYTISDTTVGSILKDHGEPPAPERSKGMTWNDFIANHRDVLLGCDFLTKEVWTLLGPITYYILFFIHIASRKVHVAGITRNPNGPWMQQIARNLTMSDVGFAHGMKYLILDRDTKHTEAFRGIFESAGVECLRLPPRSPNLNAYAERFVRSIKEECLDRLILPGEGSLHRAIDQFIEHYHAERPHQGKGNIILFPSNTSDDPPPKAGPVLCRRRLGGLLKFYYRDAA